MTSLVVITICLYFTSFLVKSQDPSLLVNSDAGSFQGFYNDDGARVWKGIPFAQPPIGNLRFTAPKKYSKINEVYNANFSAPGCMQDLKRCPKDLGIGAYCPDEVSEDCLFLTVTAPNKLPDDTKGYAVMVWIFGGSFVAGHGSSYEVSSFAKDNVILVTFNYRLNVYGFLATDTLKGNYGFLDQRMALQWVHDNIQAFGGDPSRVTIAGESAGAMSVSAHLASPESQGLFRSIIMMSSPLAISFQNRSNIKTQAELVFNYIGCDIKDIKCIRTATTDQLNAAYVNKIAGNYLALTPLVEVYGDIPQQPYITLKTGAYNTSISVLAGFTKDEGYLVINNVVNTTMTKKDTQNFYKSYMGDKYALYSPYINFMYPYDNSVKDGRDVISKILTDYIFACPLLRAAQGASSSRQNIYIYEYIHIYTQIVNFGDSPLKNCVGYACHAFDLPFVFTEFWNSPFSFYYKPTVQEMTLVNSIHNMWINFITTQNPNKGPKTLSTAALNPFSTKRQLTTLDTTPNSMITTYPRDTQCQVLWDIAGLFGGYPQSTTTATYDFTPFIK